MSRLIPGLPTDVFKKVDDLIADVKPILVEVDTTLITVSTTLTDVDVSLGQATATLTDVKGLLGDLETKLELLDEVPAMKQQLAEVHAMLSGLTAGARSKK